MVHYFFTDLLFMEVLVWQLAMKLRMGSTKEVCYVELDMT